jgi:hypothetical protein
MPNQRWALKENPCTVPGSGSRKRGIVGLFLNFNQRIKKAAYAPCLSRKELYDLFYEPLASMRAA